MVKGNVKIKNLNFNTLAPNEASQPFNKKIHI